MTKILIDEAVVRQALDASATCSAAFQDLVESLAPRISAERMRLELRAEEAAHNKALAHAEARAACIAALAEQPAPAQPDPDELTIAYMSGLHEGKKSKPWVGLTDEEVWDLWNAHTEQPFPEWFVDFKRAYKVIEARLKEKNT